MVDVNNCGLTVFKKLHDKLYDYQREGVSFLYGLHRDGRKGGILADDMGLGKTIQIISFLSGMYDNELIKHTLLVMPTSLIPNWTRELATCTLGIRVTIFHGISKVERSRSLEKVQRRGGVIITTYTMLMNNWQQLSSYHGQEFCWDYVILDEAHKIKNTSTKTAKSAYAIPSRNRILLTGTPVQNNLREMWTLFDFACQGALLGTAKTFKTEYENPITRAREKDATPGEKALGSRMSENLMALIKPYFLRRTKSEVQKKKTMVKEEPSDKKDNTDSGAVMPKLTRKNDLIVWTYLSAVQEDIYRQFIDLDHIKELLMTSRSPLAELNILKKLCDHPRLLSAGAIAKLGLEDDGSQGDGSEADANGIANIPDDTLISESGKLVFLLALLEKLREEGHRTLVFAHYRKVLDIIERILGNRGFKVLRLDGTITQLAERERLISRFQEDRRYSVFLLTTQVGGVGITLTAANRVVIYNPSWNPATDAQAVDRAYRIGQTQNVVIYRLITCGTVEEKIYRRQVFKDSLIRQNTGDKKNPFRYFSRQELKELFTLEEPRSSSTQLQLQALHSRHRRTDPALEQHITQLHAMHMFGISDHDLLFSLDIHHDEAPENPEEHHNIEGRVQKAQELVRAECQLQMQLAVSIRPSSEPACLRQPTGTNRRATLNKKRPSYPKQSPSPTQNKNFTILNFNQFVSEKTDNKKDAMDQSGSDKEDKKDKVLDQSGSDEEQNQGTVLDQSGSDEEQEIQEKVLDQSGSDKEKNQETVSDQSGSEEEDSQKRVLDESGSDEEHNQGTVSDQSGSDDKENQVTMSDQSGSEEDSQENMLEQTSSDDEENQVTVLEQAGSDDEENQVTVLEQAGSDEEQEIQEKLLDHSRSEENYQQNVLGQYGSEKGEDPENQEDKSGSDEEHYQGTLLDQTGSDEEDSQEKVLDQSRSDEEENQVTVSDQCGSEEEDCQEKVFDHSGSEEEHHQETVLNKTGSEEEGRPDGLPHSELHLDLIQPLQDVRFSLSNVGVTSITGPDPEPFDRENNQGTVLYQTGSEEEDSQENMLEQTGSDEEQQIQEKLLDHSRSEDNYKQNILGQYGSEKEENPENPKNQSDSEKEENSENQRDQSGSDEEHNQGTVSDQSGFDEEHNQVTVSDQTGSDEEQKIQEMVSDQSGSEEENSQDNVLEQTSSDDGENQVMVSDLSGSDEEQKIQEMVSDQSGSEEEHSQENVLEQTSSDDGENQVMVSDQSGSEEEQEIQEKLLDHSCSEENYQQNVLGQYCSEKEENPQNPKDQSGSDEKHNQVMVSDQSGSEEEQEIQKKLLVHSRSEENYQQNVLGQYGSEKEENLEKPKDQSDSDEEQNQEKVLNQSGSDEKKTQETVSDQSGSEEDSQETVLDHSGSDEQQEIQEKLLDQSGSDEEKTQDTVSDQVLVHSSSEENYQPNVLGQSPSVKGENPENPKNQTVSDLEQEIQKKVLDQSGSDIEKTRETVLDQSGSEEEHNQETVLDQTGSEKEGRPDGLPHPELDLDLLQPLKNVGFSFSNIRETSRTGPDPEPFDFGLQLDDEVLEDTEPEPSKGRWLQVNGSFDLCRSLSESSNRHNVSGSRTGSNTARIYSREEEEVEEQLKKKKMLLPLTSTPKEPPSAYGHHRLWTNPGQAPSLVYGWPIPQFWEDLQDLKENDDPGTFGLQLAESTEPSANSKETSYERSPTDPGPRPSLSLPDKTFLDQSGSRERLDQSESSSGNDRSLFYVTADDNNQGLCETSLSEMDLEHKRVSIPRQSDSRFTGESHKMSPEPELFDENFKDGQGDFLEESETEEEQQKLLSQLQMNGSFDVYRSLSESLHRQNLSRSRTGSNTAGIYSREEEQQLSHEPESFFQFPGTSTARLTPSGSSPDHCRMSVDGTSPVASRRPLIQSFQSIGVVEEETVYFSEIDSEKEEQNRKDEKSGDVWDTSAEERGRKTRKTRRRTTKVIGLQWRRRVGRQLRRSSRRIYLRHQNQDFCLSSTGNPEPAFNSGVYDSLVRRGKECYSLGKLQEALEFLLKAIDIKPGDPDVQLMTIQLYRQLGQQGSSEGQSPTKMSPQEHNCQSFTD